MHLALREEFASEETNGLVLGSCEVLHDAAEDVACNLLNGLLYPDD
ncbi:Hypothetical protein SynRCC307_1973 [Synechococcus sp. RCC307]|nr:Hypothetical protein SynRCC307_1973 [Synechococcus sp. RCC307]